MKAHARHVVIALIVMLILLVVATVVARAQDFSAYSGAQLYTRLCASCHGANGRGDGPVAASLVIMVPDLTRIAQRHGGTFPEEQVRRIIDGRQTLPPHGSRAMPVWGFEFGTQTAGQSQSQDRTNALISRLTEHVRSMQKN
jgi:mono/diheme cytochrome c family protein